MKKRLFLIIMFISVAVSISSSVITTFIYHNLYVNEAKSQLKTIVALEKNIENWDNKSKISNSINKILNATNYNMRFTIVDFNGDVIYDNWAQDGSLENHKNRPEIAEAFVKGNGEHIRYSDTIESDMYYYAVKISDNEVLRVAREINSINSTFLNIIPILLILSIGLLIIVYVVASSFTKRILKPIKEMTRSLDEMLDDEETQSIPLYEEFGPLSHKILEQKIKINQYIEELKYERDTINIITENMKEGFILINKNKHVLSINSSGKRMIGNNKFDLKDNRNIIELTRNNEILQRINTSINENKHIVYDMDTNHNHYRYYLSPVKEHKKPSVAGILILIEDVTIQKNAEIMRSEFSANVSHELKTPLTTMIGFAEVIKEGLITDLDSIQKYCGMIHKEGLRLISLIEDIIRLSKIEEGIEYNNTTVNLREKAKEVISLLQSKAETLNIKLYLHADNVIMVANENYISELLYNLIDNGIKYNNKDGGFVSVSIYKSEKYIIIKVKDNGVGISGEHQDRIFERFYRADKSRSKETGGTGLGLSIVKHIIELYDGSIELKSQQFKGTEILIKFLIN